jgi:hypothetical protein
VVLLSADQAFRVVPTLTSTWLKGWFQSHSTSSDPDEKFFMRLVLACILVGPQLPLWTSSPPNFFQHLFPQLYPFPPGPIPWSLTIQGELETVLTLDPQQANQLGPWGQGVVHTPSRSSVSREAGSLTCGEDYKLHCHI